MTTLSRKIRKYERPFYYGVTAIIALSFFVWTAPFSDAPDGEAAGTIAGEPVTRVELENVKFTVDILALLDGFSRSPALSPSFARGRWMQTLIQVRDALRDPRLSSFYLQYVGLGDVGDITSHEGREALAWKWIAYLRAAEQAGFTVTDSEVTQFIREIFGVPPNAPFPKDGYLQILRARLRLDVAVFERTVERHLLAAKYFDAVGAAAVVSSQELLDAYLEENREVELAWMDFVPKVFSASAPEPSREAVARHFRDSGGQYRLPAKASVEYLLAEPSAFLEGIGDPAEADITTRYEALKDTEYRDPDGGKDGKPLHKPLAKVRDAIVQDLKKANASLKASELLQKALLEIGAIEAKQSQDESVRLDFAALAKQYGVLHGETPYFEETHADDAEACFGAFGDARDRDAFLRKVFTDMKEGEVMRGELRPLATAKGWLIYRLLRRKAARPRVQLTAEVEDDILRQLRKRAMDQAAVDAARRWIDAIGADGLEKAETALGKTFHRPPAVKRGNPIPDPDGEHGQLSDGGRIVETAFALRQANQVGKARLLDTGSDRVKYVVVLLKALEAKMDDFEKQKPWLRERLLMNGFENGKPVPGKRQLLIDARRAEIEKAIAVAEADAKPAEGAPKSRPAPATPKKGAAPVPEAKAGDAPPKAETKTEGAEPKPEPKAEPAPK